MMKRLEGLKNTVNKYMANMRPNRLTTCESERKSVWSRRRIYLWCMTNLPLVRSSESLSAWVSVMNSLIHVSLFCCRMVLDPKTSSHNDYGSIQSHSNGNSDGPRHPHHAIDISGIAHQSCSDDTGLHTDNESVRLTHDMTQSDLYQRQVCTSFNLSDVMPSVVFSHKCWFNAPLPPAWNRCY
jgi:hypothetical protein